MLVCQSQKVQKCLPFFAFYYFVLIPINIERNQHHAVKSAYLLNVIEKHHVLNCDKNNA